MVASPLQLSPCPCRLLAGAHPCWKWKEPKGSANQLVSQPQTRDYSRESFDFREVALEHVALFSESGT
eukprot:3125780-Amphidinium_carterae.1